MISYGICLSLSDLLCIRWQSLGPSNFPGAQIVKNLTAVQEARVQSLSWEDPLEKGQQPTPVFLPGESHGQRSLAGYSLWGRRVRHNWATNTGCCKWHYFILFYGWVVFHCVYVYMCGVNTTFSLFIHQNIPDFKSLSDSGPFWLPAAKQRDKRLFSEWRISLTTSYCKAKNCTVYLGAP